MSATAETTIDPLLADEFQTNPAGVLARLRAEDPVHFIPGLGAWMICRYDDVLRLFTDPNVTNAISRSSAVVPTTASAPTSRARNFAASSKPPSISCPRARAC